MEFDLVKLDGMKINTLAGWVYRAVHNESNCSADVSVHSAAVVIDLDPVNSEVSVDFHNRNPVPDVPYRHHANTVEPAQAVHIMSAMLPGGHTTLGWFEKGEPLTPVPETPWLTVGRPRQVHG